MACVVRMQMDACVRMPLVFFLGWVSPVARAEQSLGKPDLDSVPRVAVCPYSPISPAGFDFASCSMALFPSRLEDPVSCHSGPMSNKKGAAPFAWT